MRRTSGSPKPARELADVSPRRSGGQAADGTRKSPPRLKIRSGPGSVIARQPRPQQATGTAKTLRLAAGTAQPPAGVVVRPAGAKTGDGRRVLKADEALVQSVEIRPSGTVVSRRPNLRRPAILHLPLPLPAAAAPPAWMLEACQVAPARAGDQSELLHLLAGLPAAPTRAEFHAAVDHPEHDSANRLVARLGGRIVGHLEIVPRDVLVGGATVRGAVLDRLAVLPECRGAGHGQRLVQEAEERLRRSQAVVAFSRTRIAASYQELGWSVLGRDAATPGRPTEILARLLDEQQPRDGESVTMRQWRHVELPAILRIYRQNALRYTGPADRDETYARWLVSRGAFDSIIVALVGQDRYELKESSARIVGYCVQSGTRVLEIAADPEFPGLDREILARVCAEAIENDRQEITYESSAADALHAAVAGDTSLVHAGDRMIVAKVLRPLELLTALAPLVAARVAADGVREMLELGLDAPGLRASIVVADGTVVVQPGRVGRSYLTLSAEELARLLLGQCDPAEAAAAGRLEASTQVAVKLAGQLFPRTPLWCPLWDDLPA